MQPGKGYKFKLYPHQRQEPLLNWGDMWGICRRICGDAIHFPLFDDFGEMLNELIQLVVDRDLVVVKIKYFDWNELENQIKRIRNNKVDIPLIIGGKEIRTGNTATISPPHDHKHILGVYHKAGVKFEYSILLIFFKMNLF